MKNKIMNIVNFVRGIEPRGEMDLYKPVDEQVALAKKYNVPATFLLQYDAMLRNDFQSLFLREKGNALIETGVWFENCRALIEKIGLVWRGREGYDWDWLVDVGFLEGYTCKEREMIIDEVFRFYKELFGEYPKVVGSWIMDAHSMKYMADNYEIKAFCICREQHGVDAYTLWGGYFNGGYYPSKNNMLCPAQSVEGQISVPVFRMLGIDPLYGYDLQKYSHEKEIVSTEVYTLEPAWKYGQDEKIVDWYFETYYKTPILSFAHMTTGQENSFGWDCFGKGYIMQLQKLALLREQGVVALETLGDTGENFQKAYALTPPQAQVVLRDLAEHGHQTVWYNCKNYRTNLFFRNGKLFFRDLNKYDEKYCERYLEQPCTGWLGTYDALPLIDSRLWSNEEKSCGLVLKKEVAEFDVATDNEKQLTVSIEFSDGMKGKICFTEQEILFVNCGELEYSFGALDNETELWLEKNTIQGKHNGFGYKMEIFGTAVNKPQVIELLPCDGEIKLKMV